MKKKNMNQNIQKKKKQKMRDELNECNSTRYDR